MDIYYSESSMLAQSNGKDFSMRKGVFHKREKRPDAQDEDSLDLRQLLSARIVLKTLQKEHGAVHPRCLSAELHIGILNSRTEKFGLCKSPDANAVLHLP